MTNTLFSRSPEKTILLTDNSIGRMVERGQAIEAMDILTMANNDDAQTDAWIDYLKHKGLLVTHLDKERLDYPELGLAVQNGWARTCRTLIKQGKDQNALTAWALKKSVRAQSARFTISLLQNAAGFPYGSNDATEKWCSLAQDTLADMSRLMTPTSDGGSAGRCDLQRLMIFLERAWGQRSGPQGPSGKALPWNDVVTQAMDAFLQSEAPRGNTLGHKPKEWWAGDFLEVFLAHGANPDGQRVIAHLRDSGGWPMTLANFVGTPGENPILYEFLDWWNDGGRLWAPDGPEQSVRKMRLKDETASLRGRTWSTDVDDLEADAKEMTKVMMTWLQPTGGRKPTAESDKSSAQDTRRKDDKSLTRVPIGGYEALFLPQSSSRPILFSFQNEFIQNHWEEPVSVGERGRSSQPVRHALEEVLREKLLDAWERAPREELMGAARLLRTTADDFHEGRGAEKPQHEPTWMALGWATTRGTQELANLRATTTSAHLCKEFETVEEARAQDEAFGPPAISHSVLSFTVQRVSALLRASSRTEAFEALVDCFLDELVSTWIPDLKRGHTSRRSEHKGNVDVAQRAVKEDIRKNDIPMVSIPKKEHRYGPRGAQGPGAVGLGSAGGNGGAGGTNRLGRPEELGTGGDGGHAGARQGAGRSRDKRRQSP